MDTKKKRKKTNCQINVRIIIFCTNNYVFSFTISILFIRRNPWPANDIQYVIKEVRLWYHSSWVNILNLYFYRHRKNPKDQKHKSTPPFSNNCNNCSGSVFQGYYRQNLVSFYWSQLLSSQDHYAIFGWFIQALL